MRSGDRPGLQNRRAAGNPVTGGFDPHSLPPIPLSETHIALSCHRVRNLTYAALRPTSAEL